MPRPGDPISLLARPVFWTVGFVTGLLDAALTPADLRRRQELRQWKNQWRRWVRQNTLAEPGQTGYGSVSGDLSLDALRAGLLGRSRAEIVESLGPPPATSALSQLDALPPKPAHYWHADVWYYPADVHRRFAVALIFENDVVSAIEQLAGPR